VRLAPREVPALERQLELSYLVVRLGGMDEDTNPLRGIELRYLLTLTIWQSVTPLSIAELTSRLADSGFALAGRPSKAISDALRWEVAKGAFGGSVGGCTRPAGSRGQRCGGCGGASRQLSLQRWHFHACPEHPACVDENSVPGAGAHT
jgi:hypothetical protein